MVKINYAEIDSLDHYTDLDLFHEERSGEKILDPYIS